jgi:hypothetical protein
MAISHQRFSKNIRSLKHMTRLTHLSLIICLVLLIGSCRKDKTTPAEVDSNCPEFLETQTNYQQAFINDAIEDDMFEESYDITLSQLDKGIDIDCDGIADFKIQSTSNSDYFEGYYTELSELTFTIKSNNLSVLTENHMDTTYSYWTVDTVGSTIYSYGETSNIYRPEAAVASVYNNTYVKGLTIGDQINVLDSAWESNPIQMRYYYSVSSSWNFGPDVNGYYEEAESVTKSNLGLIDSEHNYIALKYEGKKGTKLCYIKIDAGATGSYPYASFHFKRMHR